MQYRMQTHRSSNVSQITSILKIISPVKVIPRFPVIMFTVIQSFVWKRGFFSAFMAITNLCDIFSVCLQVE